MSLTRMSVRAATVLALTNYYSAPWPTMARGRVFDSLIDPIQGAKKDDLIPSITVYTDDDVGNPLSENNGGPPFRREVTMSMWLTIGQMGEDDDVGDQTLVLPQTDAQLEAMLDLFEYQVRFCFANYQNKWSRLMTGLFTRVNSWKSDRLATEANVRLAARNITAIVELCDDDVPDAILSGETGAPLPEGVQRVVDAVAAEEDPPRGGIHQTIELMQSATVPTTLTFERLRTIWLRDTHPRDEVADKAVSDKPIAPTDDLYPG